MFHPDLCLLLIHKIVCEGGWEHHRFIIASVRALLRLMTLVIWYNS
jgi:hypothetical protein